MTEIPGALSTPPVPPSIEWLELTLRCDATLTVGQYGGNPTEWMKPGAEGKLHLNGMPTPEQLVAAYDYLQNHVIGPSLTQTITFLQQKLLEAQAHS